MRKSGPFPVNIKAQPRPNGPLVLPATVQQRAHDPKALVALIQRGRQAHAQGDFAAAERHFSAVLEAAPESADAHYHLGLLEMEMRRYRPAQAHLLKALKRGAHLEFVNLAYAKACLDDGQAEKAEAHVRKALAINPDSKDGQNMLVAVLEQTGRLEEAAAHAKALFTRDPDHASAIARYASEVKFKGSEPEISLFQDALARATDPLSKRDIAYALGKIYNDFKDYDAAFKHFRIAAETFSGVTDAMAQAADTFRRTKEAYLRIRDRMKDGLGNGSDAPIFIVGMPRSGTTLTEQILASHPSVCGVGEQAALGSIARNLDMQIGRKQGHLRALTQLTPPQRAALGENYLNTMRGYGEHPRYADKFPHNFLRVGLIRLLFPKAKIVHCTRNAIDNCVSIYTSPLNEAHLYAKDLKVLGGYYRLYADLMRFWRDDMGIEMFEMRYEDTVADIDAQARALVAFAGLEWDDRCLAFHKADTQVSTISLWQVRQPIYSSSVKRWKAYEGHIAPLIDALGDLAQTG